MNQREPPDWVILNQSYNAEFVRAMARVGDGLSGLLYGGVPGVPGQGSLEVQLGPTLRRTSIRSRAATWLAYTAWAAHRCSTLAGDPFVFVATNPPLLPHLAWLLKRMRGFRYGVLVWDIYPHHLVHAGLFRENSAPVSLWHALNRRALAEAEVVITLGKRMAETLMAELPAGNPKLPVSVVPSWVDVERIRPLDKQQNSFARAHEQLGRVTVLYSGNIGRTHRLESLIEAAKQLESEPDVSFLVVGDGLGREEIATTIERLRTVNVTLLDYQPSEVVPLSLATGDIAVVSQEPGTEALSVPSKTYSAMAAGSAILALTTADSDLAELVLEHDVGLVVPHESGAIARALRSLKDDPDRLRQLQANARRAAVAHFSMEVVTKQLAELLRPHLRRFQQP